MAVIDVAMFTWRECSVCGHDPADHHVSLPHYGCYCISSQYRMGGEYVLELVIRNRWVRRYQKKVP